MAHARSKADRCTLALEDGTALRGYSFGATGTQCGEVVFNTSMTGYQEILTDPSYCGQILVMTYPLIGNYGVNLEDMESPSVHASGFAVKELATLHSNHRAAMPLADFLRERGVVGIQGIDTRALVMKLRTDGVMRGVITTETHELEDAVRLAKESPSMIGADLVKVVAPSDTSQYVPSDTDEPHGSKTDATRSWHVVAIDCGMKRNILRQLDRVGCSVTILPPTATVSEALEHKPQGVFVSNGPGDPSAVHYATKLVNGLIGRVPIFGICLGHQLIGCALGASTYKLKFGHRGANQPVKNLATGRVEITSQNHGFAVDTSSLEAAGGVVTHINLNDETLEGFVHRDHPLLAVQYHPEASPGPHDASYLFDCFVKMMETGRSPDAQEMSLAQQMHQRGGQSVSASTLTA